MESMVYVPSSIFALSAGVYFSQIVRRRASYGREGRHHKLSKQSSQADKQARGVCYRLTT